MHCTAQCIQYAAVQQLPGCVVLPSRARAADAASDSCCKHVHAAQPTAAAALHPALGRERSCTPCAQVTRSTFKDGAMALYGLSVLSKVAIAKCTFRNNIDLASEPALRAPAACSLSPASFRERRPAAPTWQRLAGSPPLEPPASGAAQQTMHAWFAPHHISPQANTNP